MHHRAQANLFPVLCLALLASSCTVPMDDRFSLDDDGGVDFTEYAGLQIIGTLTIDGSPLNPKPAPLDMALLTVGLYTRCMDRFEEEGERALLNYCTGYSGASSSVCPYKFCDTLVFNCLASELMTLAESTDVFEFETTIANYSAERYEEEIVFDILDGRLINPDTGQPGLHSYRIPPLNAPQKTLALLAARAAAKKAAKYIFQLATENTECIQELAEETSCGVEIATSCPAGSPALMDYFVHAVGETISLTAEAARKGAANQASVASSVLGKQNNYAAAQDEAWNSKLNSYSSAMSGLFGRATVDASGVLLNPGCGTNPTSPPVTRAADLLRAAGLAATFSPETTDAEVVDQLIEAQRKDLGMEDPGPSPQEYLNKRGITLASISIARRHLQEETVALRRVPSPNEAASQGGPARIYGLSAKAMQHPPAYHMSRSLASSGVNRTELNLEEVMNEGAAHTVALVRMAAESLLVYSASIPPTAAQILTNGQQAALSKAALSAKSLAGDHIMMVTMTNAFETSGEASIAIMGAKEEDSYLIVKGEEGLRCAMESSIDGAPCSLADHLVSFSQQYYIPGNPIQGPLDRLWYLDFLGGGFADGDDLHVINGSAPPAKRYVGGFKAQSYLATLMPVIGGSVLADMAANVYSRQPGQCGVPIDPCGDLGLPRDFSPPLENELTQASGDPSVEDSWRHYLNLARAASDEADRLCEQLIQSGLEMDVRADNARRTLEEICGDVVNIPSIDATSCAPGGPDPDCNVVNQYISEDPGLSSCLPTDQGGGMQRDFVSLGVPVCLYQWEKSGQICTCPPNVTGCPNQCPMPATGDTDTPEECATQFTHSTGWTVNGDTAKFIYVGNALRIFESTGPRIQSSIDRVAVMAEIDRLDDIVTNQSLSPMLRATEVRAWLDSNNRWVNLGTLKLLAQSMRFERKLLHHYAVKLNGSEIWSTLRTDQSMCPPFAPWKDMNSAIACVRAGDNKLSPPVNGHEVWLGQELFGPDSPSQVRSVWANGVFENMFWLGVLTGETRGLQVSGYWRRNSGYPTDDVTVPGSLSHDLVARLQNKGFSSEPVMCLQKTVYSSLTFLDGYDDDSEIAPCHYYYPGDDSHDGLYRAVFPLDYSGVFPFARMNAFWNDEFVSFLSGGYPTGWAWRLEGATRYNRLNVEYTSEGNLSTKMDTPVFKFNPDLKFIPTFKGESTLSRFGLLELLRFAAYMLSESRGPLTGCDPQNPMEGMPVVQSEEDLKAVENHILCVADSINVMGEVLVLPNMPTILAEGYKQSGIETYYPGFQGENLKAIVSLEADLERFRTSAAGISDVLRRVALQVDALYLAAKKLGIQKTINRLQTAVNVIQTAIQAVSSAMSPTGILSVPASGAVEYLQAAIGGLNEDVIEIDEQLTFNQGMSGLGDRLSELRNVLSDITTSMESIQKNLATLDQLQNKASMAFADMLFLDSDTAGHVLQVNTVMRRRQNTIRIRYENALARARKLAFIARRAIELRLGVDMHKMTDGMTLVPPPAEWVDRVCEMQGCDYQKLRDAYPEDPLLDPTLQGSDSYAHWYIGDYVKLLGDFVESYNIDYPFTDEHDIAVISVKNDIMRVSEPCERASYNMLYHSGNPGMSHLVTLADGSEVLNGWEQGGCLTGDHCLEVLDATAFHWCDSSFCFGEPIAPVNPLDPEDPAHPAKATRIRDMEHRLIEVAPGVSYSTRDASGMNSGYLKQRVRGVAPGTYFLTWYDRSPSSPSESYRVEIWDVGVDPAQELPDSYEGDATPMGFARRRLEVTIDETTDLEVRIHPSHADDYLNQTPVFGDVVIWGMQLEWVNPMRCVPNCGAAAYLPFEETSDRLTTVAPGCSDIDGSEMRKQFTWGCVCIQHDQGKCPENGSLTDDRYCYYEYVFPVTLDALDKGTLIPSNNIALRNFNYRLEALAINVVGTNVLDCSTPWSTTTCYTNAFVPFTLEHQGADLPIRNHTGDTELFTLPTDRVEHGKGLAAEVVLTNPVTGTHSQLLSEYWKDGIRGRPLQGTYVLRIWQTPDLDWGRVEDIQLAWKYRYWTKSSW